MKIIILILTFFAVSNAATAQDFYFGADLSYVNELEDCGVTYKENGNAKDPYQIFSDHACNLIRLRLWHTPDWYDELNSGHRYSDLNDVKKSISRAKAQGMKVLLDFHLSDNWADPGKQIVPAAWSGIVDELEILKDSLYNYIFSTLDDLNQNNLLPEMVQIGNETNRGILLSQAVNDSGWVLDWIRQSELFNEAIQAVRDFETENNQSLKIAIHLADPVEVNWHIENFIANGVTDFDIIGISYYDNWHGETSIPEVGNIISELIDSYNKEVMIFEAGYPWTMEWNDNANNTQTAANPAYSPLSPENQKQWLIDLCQTVKNNGGKGLIYWEPAWVSSSCHTQWGEGSHYENATFFDFQNNLHLNGGVQWMEESLVSRSEINRPEIEILLQKNHRIIEIQAEKPLKDSLVIQLYALDGRLLKSQLITIQQTVYEFNLPELANGVYLLSISAAHHETWVKKVNIFQK